MNPSVFSRVASFKYSLLFTSIMIIKINVKIVGELQNLSKFICLKRK